ncbi:MAG TPA: TolC family protein [Puia sp.]|nr:TolC family protein [Puia sp.]
MSFRRCFLICGFALAAVLASPLSTPAQRRVISIKDVLALVESGQPQLQAYKEQAMADRYGIDIARNTLVPGLSAGYQAGYASDNNITGLSYPGLLLPISGPVNAASSSTMVPGTALAALLQWTPLTFGQRSAAIEKASAQFKLAGTAYDNALFQQRYAGILTYLAIIYLQKLLVAEQENIDRTRVSLGQSLVLAGEGLRPGLDTVQFQSLFAQAKMQRLNTESVYEAQVLELCRLTGLSGAPETFVFADTLLTARLPSVPDTGGGFAQNPGYRYYQAQVSVSAANLKQIQRGWRPTLNLWANAYSRGSGIEPDGTIDKGQGWNLTRSNLAAGFQLSVPILQFSSVNLQKKQFQALLRSDQDRLSQIAVDLRRQIETAESNYRHNLLVAQEAPVQSRAAGLSYLGLQLSYKSGLVDFTQLTQGQYQLLSAETMEANAYLQVWRSLLDIAVAKGNLNLFTDQLK